MVQKNENKFKIYYLKRKVIERKITSGQNFERLGELTARVICIICNIP